MDGNLQTGQPNASDASELVLDWQTYHAEIERLACIIKTSNWAFDHILCLARGGLRPGDVLSRLFRVPLSILTTSSYREQAGRQQGRLDIAEHITGVDEQLHGRVLLVDDLVDSGRTLAQVMEHLASHLPNVREVRTAVLWYKACSVVKPDFYCRYLPGNPWIRQPFEEYDTMCIDDLLGRHPLPITGE